jgi:hypothetical protein
MEPKKFRQVKGPEAIIQTAIMNKLRMLKWVVRSTHGNMFQAGFPDIYCAHRMYGARWVEVKTPDRRGDIFTPAQFEFFPQLMSVGIGVYVLTSDSDEQIALLHKEPNWYHFLQCMRKF